MAIWLKMLSDQTPKAKTADLMPNPAVFPPFRLRLSVASIESEADTLQIELGPTRRRRPAAALTSSLVPPHTPYWRGILSRVRWPMHTGQLEGGVITALK